MATILSGSSIKLNNGQKVNAAQGGWYDGQQFWGGTLSNPGQINPQSNQQGAGQAVSQQVNAQTNPANVDFVNQQRASIGLDASPDATNATPVPNEQVLYPNGFDSTGAAGGAGAAGGGALGGIFGLSGGIGAGGAAGGGFGGLGIGTGQAALNLPGLYESLSKQAGITDLENQLTAKQAGYNDAKSKINDNPYLSESDRTGRQDKLTMDYNADVKNTQDSLAMKKQDIQTKLDLQTKQFDINSQVAKAALDQFNTLLASGALSGASGSDIAAITAATGISSGEIQAAINYQKQKDVQTSIQTIDDGKNIYSVVINSKTGAIISKQAIGTSKPSAASTGGNPGSSQYLSSAISAVAPQIVSKLNSYGNISPQDWQRAQAAWLGAGLNKNDFVSNFGQYADPNRGDFLQAYGFANPKTAATIKSNQAANTKPL